MNMGVVVAPGDPWRFFKDIYDDLCERHHVSVFESREVKAPFFHTRINRYVFQRDLENFLKSQDVVFFEWASDLLAEASQMPKVTRIVTRLHRYEMFQWSSQVNWENVDRVILVSHAMQRKFTERFPQYADKAVVIHEAVDTQKFQPVQKPFGGDIGTLCFFTPRKRVYELILAFAELIQKRPGFRLHLGGSSNKFADYNDAVYGLPAKLGISDQVHFYGDVSDPWNWYRNVDIFISNSYSEGLQVAPMEAMAAGRYTLSHAWDGADELLPAENLFLTDSQMHKLILDYAEAGEAGQHRQQELMRKLACEKFDTRKIVSQVRQVVDSVAQAEAEAALRPA